MNYRIKPKHLQIIHFRHIIVLMLSGMAVVINMLLRTRPEKVEYGYSRMIYPHIAEFCSAAARALPAPLSLTEFMLIIFMLCIVGVTLVSLSQTIKEKHSLIRYGVKWVVEMAALGGLLYFIFWLIWGLNYLREPFPVPMRTAASQQSLTSDDYYQFARSMAHIANLTALQHDGRSETFDPSQLDRLCSQAVASVIESTLNYTMPDPPPTKLLLFNLFFEAVGISGIFSPFFMEPHIDKNLPLWAWPDVMIHEKIHFMGFASEQETVFISRITCLSSRELPLKYAGALKSLMAVAVNLPPDVWQKLAQDELIPQVQQDIIAWRKWHKSRYDRYPRLHRLSYKTNDLYLKANLQTSGIMSYSEALPRLVLWWKENPAFVEF